MYQNIDTINRMRYEDLLREANNERLVKAAQADEASRYYSALVALGRGLSAVGDELQARYGELCRSQEANYQPGTIGTSR
jgi:hypothetical protein